MNDDRTFNSQPFLLQEQKFHTWKKFQGVTVSWNFCCLGLSVPQNSFPGIFTPLQHINKCNCKSILSILLVNQGVNKVCLRYTQVLIYLFICSESLIWHFGIWLYFANCLLSLFKPKPEFCYY